MNRYNQIRRLTTNTIWEYDKTHEKHHIQKSQDDGPFPAGDHKAARNGQDSLTDKHKKDPQTKHRLRIVSKTVIGELHYV